MFKKLVHLQSCFSQCKINIEFFLTFILSASNDWHSPHKWDHFIYKTDLRYNRTTVSDEPGNAIVFLAFELPALSRSGIVPCQVTVDNSWNAFHFSLRSLSIRGKWRAILIGITTVSCRVSLLWSTLNIQSLRTGSKVVLVTHCHQQLSKLCMFLWRVVAERLRASGSSSVLSE